MNVLIVMENKDLPMFDNKKAPLLPYVQVHFTSLTLKGVSLTI